MSKDSQPVKLPLHVRPIETRDLVRLNDVAVRAFAEDELFAWLAPKRYEYPMAWRSWMALRHQRRVVEKGTWGVVCVPSPHAYDHDKIMGFAWFERHSGTMNPQATESEKLEAKKNDPWLQNHSSWLDKINWKLRQLEFDLIEKLKLNQASDYEASAEFLSTSANDESVFGPLYAGVRHWHCAVLAVDPAYHRKGAGSAIMRWILKLADEESQRLGYSVPVTLTASTLGAKLYPTLDFKIVDWQQAPPSFTSMWGNLAAGQAFVWDKDNTWVEQAPEGATSNGKRVDVVWTKLAKSFLKDKEIIGNTIMDEGQWPQIQNP